MTQLSTLAKAAGLETSAFVDLEISNLTQDSRQAKKGVLFAALPGSQVNGLDFIPQAIEQGCEALLVPSFAALALRDLYKVSILASSDCRKSFALMAAALSPDLPNTRIAITGTNGKTSVAHFVRELLSAAGLPTASAGTLGLQPVGLAKLPPLTTPDPVALFKAMNQVKMQGFDHFVMEASSHGLEQRRLDGFDPHIAVFTNLSRDHLDYHHDMAAYGDAKFRLFRSLIRKDGLVVTNVDDAFSDQILCMPKRTLTFGNKAADLQILATKSNTEGQALSLSVLGKRVDLQVPQIGAYQAHNLMAALAVALGVGLDETKALSLLSDLSGVPGRMEIAAHKDGKLAIIDYAHTPEALEVALKSARPHASGKLRVVFGAGGDRDEGKRPLMGKAANTFADVAYVTDDNPRSEDPALIRQAVLTGGVYLIDAGDRSSAISRALEDCKSGDVLVIAGKGHETTQDIAGVKHAFDDRLVAAELAANIW